MSSVRPKTVGPALHSALERCCVALESEIARQEQVLEICQEQGRAARLRDVDALERATGDLAASVEGVLRAEAERVAAVMDAARGLGLSPENVRLSRLIASAPEPWRERLQEIQRRLRTVVGVTHRVVEANGRYLREGARTAERLLGEVVGEAPAAPSRYERDGQPPSSWTPGAVLLNVAG